MLSVKYNNAYCARMVHGLSTRRIVKTNQTRISFKTFNTQTTYYKKQIMYFKKSCPYCNEGYETLVIWQGFRIRCNTCRVLQSRRSSSCRETDSYFILCGEKKPSLNNLRMHQPSIYSNKKEILVCYNQRGISLFSIAGKILARALLYRLNENLEQLEFLP